MTPDPSENKVPLYGGRPAWVNTSMAGAWLLALLAVAVALRGAVWIRLEPILRQAKVDVSAFAAFPWFALVVGMLILLGVRRTLWNITTYYEFWPDRLRIIHGGLFRQEREYPWSAFKFARFSQHPLQMPFRSGTLVLEPHAGEALNLEDCPEAEKWAKQIRPLIAAHPAPSHHANRGSRADFELLEDEPPVANEARAGGTGTAAPVVVVKEKSSGCMTCLVVLLILFLAPMVFGLIFKVAVFTSLMSALRDILR